MQKRLLTIGELSAERVCELLMEYDAYITDYFDGKRYEEVGTPLTAHEYYENEFLEYAKEKEFIDELLVEEEQ